MADGGKRLRVEQGSENWHRLRERARTDLYFLNAKIRGLENLIPMTPKAHYGLCRFAERRTGIPEVDGSRVQMISVARGWGKAQPLDTPIYTSSGWSTMGDLQIGDQVFTPEGNPTKVVWKSPIQLGNDVYRIEFGDGESVEADAEHLWVVLSPRYKNRLMTTKEIREDLTTGSRKDSKWRIALTSPIQFPEADLPLDPYLLGLWLGDGGRNSGYISCHPSDAQETVLQAAEENGLEVTARPKDNVYYVRGLVTKLRAAGVLEEKHVPSVYLRSSTEQRLALLQGLMDSDGEADKNCIRARFSNTNKVLSDAVYHLIVSLGMKARKNEKRAMLNGEDHGPYYEIGFRPTLPVFRLERKLERIQKDVGQSSRHTIRMIRNIVPVESKAVQCIRVAHPSSMYLTGGGLIPTHNTAAVTTGRTIQRLLIDRDWSAGIVNESSEKAKGFLAAIKNEFESNDLLRMLFPELIPDFGSTTWKSDKIEINRTKRDPVNPSVIALGVGSQTAGLHLDEFILDDLISDDAAENARSGAWTEIEKTNRWINRMQYLLSKPKKDPITIIYTPWWPGDCYDYAEEMFGRGEPERIFQWELELPADVETGEAETQHIDLIQKGELAMFKLRPFRDGRLVHPALYDWETLERLREDDPHFYSGQVLLEPSTGATTVFKDEYLREYWWESEHQIGYRNAEGRVQYERLRDLRTLIAVDPAISEKSTAARSAITVVGSNGQQLFLLDLWAKRKAPTDVAEAILERYQRYRPSRILIEDVAYQMALAEILELLAEKRRVSERLPIHPYKTGSKQKKSQRISGLEPYFRKGLFYWHPSTQHEFHEEYLNFSPDIGSRLVDILDSLSMMKESWETLGFLGRPERGSFHDAERLEADRRRAAKIRQFYSRKRGQPAPTVGGGSSGDQGSLWYKR